MLNLPGSGQDVALCNPDLTQAYQAGLNPSDRPTSSLMYGISGRYSPSNLVTGPSCSTTRAPSTIDAQMFEYSGLFPRPGDHSLHLRAPGVTCASLGHVQDFQDGPGRVLA